MFVFFPLVKYLSCIFVFLSFFYIVCPLSVLVFCHIWFQDVSDPCLFGFHSLGIWICLLQGIYNDTELIQKWNWFINFLLSFRKAWFHTILYWNTFYLSEWFNIPLIYIWRLSFSDSNNRFSELWFWATRTSMSMDKHSQWWFWLDISQWRYNVVCYWSRCWPHNRNQSRYFTRGASDPISLKGHNHRFR
jgi:hypothetical protein